MKKILLGFATVVLLTFIFLGVAHAWEVGVTCNPEVISTPNGTTTITVTSDEDAGGTITVYTPGVDQASMVGITIPAGESIQKVYPTDFPDPANTSEVGEYEVVVYLQAAGEKSKRACFWVSFNVIPEVRYGTVMATVACLVAMTVFTKIKRAPNEY